VSGWTSDKEVLSDAERDELMDVGKMIIVDMVQLLRTVSSAIKTSFTNGMSLEFCGTGTEPVRTPTIIMLFTITDLGGSDQTQVERFIEDRLLAWFEQPSLARYKVIWDIEVLES
jgi:hypothetical protein